MSQVIKKIALNNFKCFQKDKIVVAQFDSQLNILSGPNGFGKTTIFDAIELIFSHKMTRFINHEHRNQRFENHLLLNDISSSGFIVLDVLKDGEETQYAAIIENKRSYNLEDFLQESISYFKIESKYMINNLNEVSPEYLLKHISKYGIAISEAIIENFNICYYVSQENSTHLLKLSIKNREDLLSSLIGHQIVEKKYQLLKDFKDLFNYDEQKIQDTLKEIRLLKYDEELQAVKYIQLFPDLNLDWDDEVLNVGNNILKNIVLLKNLDIFKEYKLDFIKLFKNKRIDGLIEDNETIAIANIMHEQSIENVTDLNIKVEKENQSKAEIENIQRLFNKLESDLSQPILKSQNVKGIIAQIKNLELIINDDNFDLIEDTSILNSNLLGMIENLNKRIILLNLQNDISRQKLSLKHSRENILENLTTFTKMINIDEIHCPVCNTEFESLENLQTNIDSINVIIEQIAITEESKINSNWENITIMLEKVKEQFEKLNGKKNSVDWHLVDIHTFIQNQTKINKLQQLLNFAKNEDIQIEPNSNWINLIENKKETLSEDFEVKMFEISVDEFIENLESFLNVETLKELSELSNKISREQIKDKIEYLQFVKRSIVNSKYQLLREQLKSCVKEKLQWDKMRSAYLKIIEIVNNHDKKLKKSIVEAIKFPLLVYTAKMLQNYQGGLGVYIDENALRFVSSQKQPDILNRFSSGQLSAFVLTFLLLMNKLYVNKNQDYQFLLIDDPVQTMDEINLSSFVDVLRREFQDKQIILSTHEEDKKNYIGYKFVKNGCSVSILNVKEAWYDVD